MTDGADQGLAAYRPRIDLRLRASVTAGSTAHQRAAQLCARVVELHQ